MSSGTIVAQRGRQYLIDVGRGQGRILDLERGKLYPETLLLALRARGGWQPYEGPQAALPAWLRDVEDIETPNRF